MFRGVGRTKEESGARATWATWAQSPMRTTRKHAQANAGEFRAAQAQGSLAVLSAANTAPVTHHSLRARAARHQMPAEVRPGLHSRQGGPAGALCDYPILRIACFQPPAPGVAATSRRQKPLCYPPSSTPLQHESTPIAAEPWQRAPSIVPGGSISFTDQQSPRR